MNNEMTPLQALEEIKTCKLIKSVRYKEGYFSDKLIDYTRAYGSEVFYRQIPVIERALIDHEKQQSIIDKLYQEKTDVERRFVASGRLQLETLDNNYKELAKGYQYIQEQNNDNDKVWNILRNKRVNLEYIKCSPNYETYCFFCSYGKEITEAEFKLIREKVEYEK